MSELDFVNWLRSCFAADDPSVLLGCGPDDCALVRTPSGDTLALTTDMLTEGVHFLQSSPPLDVGYKALAVNLSDLAGSGCSPTWGTVAVAVGAGHDTGWARQVATGIQECASAYSVTLVGGDTVRADGPATLCITLVGTPLPGGPVTRGGARPGDLLAVTGCLGGSLRGKHLRPEPRFAEMQVLLASGAVRAGMDLSDGLGVDCYRMMAESDTGAVILADQIPVSPEALDMADGNAASALASALGDGEDFELLVALAPEAGANVIAGWPADLAPLRHIGHVVEGPKLLLRYPSGSEGPLPAAGYTHEF